MSAPGDAPGEAPGEAPGDAPRETPRLSWRSPKTEVRASSIHGTGLFAREPMAAGEIACVKGGHVFDRATLERIEPVVGSAEIQVGPDHFIGPLTLEEREGSMLYTNHSCEPTMGVAGSIVFVTLREVAAGEELTHDWCMTDDDTYEMACRCGAATCRGTIRGDDWRRGDLQRRWLPYMSWHLQQRIRAEGRG